MIFYLFFLQIFVFLSKSFARLHVCSEGGLALKLGRDCRLELFSDPLSQPLFTGNKVSGVDDTELKDMEFFLS